MLVSNKTLNFQLSAKWTAVVFCAAISFSACSSDKEDKGGGSNQTNSADEATFKQSGASLLEMVQISKSASVADQSKKKYRFVGFDRIGAFAADGTSPEDLSPANGSNKDASSKNASSLDSSSCPDVMVGGLPEFEESGDSGNDGFNITQGQSCSDALAGMKVQYSKIIDGLEGQVNALVNFDAAKFSQCNGMKAEKANVDKNTAAIAWRITPDKSTGMNGSILIFGGAMGPLVTIGSEFEGKFDTANMGMDMDPGEAPSPKMPDFDEPKDDGSNGDGGFNHDRSTPPPSSGGQPDGGSMAIEYKGKNTTTGDIVNKTLASNLNSTFSMKMAGGNQAGQSAAMSFAVNSKSLISGLTEGAKLRIDEAVDFDLGTSSDGKNETVSATYKLTVEELDGRNLKISGSVDMGPGARESFELKLTKDRSGNCQVTEVKENKTN